MKNFLIILSLVFSFFACDDKKVIDAENHISLSKAMGDVADEDFSKAVEKRKFVFPDDHGPHQDFRTEWWYFTGNLTSVDNRKFGYQLTIFRTALTKKKIERNSEWNSNQIYMAHFAVTDIDGNKFYFDERFSREGNNLAGAQINPFKVWVEDWQIIQTESRTTFELPTISIKAKTDKAEINFTLEAVKPFVLQGDEGLSQKGKQPGNASYYYSYTRLKTEGKIILSGQEFSVKGFSWMDREWSTTALSEDQKGWDWFALQLDDNTEIMYYQMRKKDGMPDVFSKGTFVDKKGASELIEKDDVVLEVTDYWESPGGEKYPSGWNLQIPSKEIDLKITPTVKNQLMDVTVRYWEGSVKIEGKKSGSKITGSGYVELTGY
ncbi:MAG: lipocalin-like domain-containing protein [Ignavibacterium sp.]|uniref:lipocalin-like domain-containing protein n=1 Tax=Ignavibacterium sp. TaxID=2651167 RepID=UPI0040495609